MELASTDWGGDVARIAAGDSGLSLVVTRDLAAVAPLWDALAERGIGSPFQARAFVEAWFRHLGSTGGAEPLIVSGRTPGGDGFVLPLAVGRLGPVRIARFPGGRHATFNLGLFDRDLWQRFSTADVHAVYRAVADARPDVGLIHFGCSPRRFAGRDNPFVGQRSVPAVHNAYASDLSGGFDDLLSRHRGGKKRGRVKSAAKSLAPVGGYAVGLARTPAEAAEILDAFFEQKARRFEAKGIPDVFACPKTRAFFHELAAAGGEDRCAMQLRRLDIDGRIRATIVGIRFGDCFYMILNSFALDEHARLGPGGLLLHHAIEDCAGAGLTRYDFGIGDARYKRSWADEEIQLAETVTPVTATGAAAAFALDLARRARAEIVARPALHRLVQKLRRSAADGADEGEE
jgi:CelD/BcsL family acetyltransferase involved in cellulose biosynthesis